MRAAKIKDGVVVNYVLVEEYTDDCIDPRDALIGDKWDGFVFKTPEKQVNYEVPESVPMRSARLILYKAGLLNLVQTYIDSLTGEGAEEAKINWEFALNVSRNDPLVKQLIPSLGKTEEEIDQMFIEASKL